jgi:hypothetical protein
LRRKLSGCLAALAAAALLSPFFFVLHRLTVFHTVPYDDYAPYLLWLDGSAQGAVPDSPYCYRLLSVLAALPFLHLLPPLPLTNLPAGIPPEWLRATLALNLVNFLALVAACLLIVRIGLRRCALAPSEALLAGMLLFALAWFTQITAIDGLALLLITSGIALLERPGAFAALLLVSVLANEKVALVLALWLGARVVLVAADRARLRLPFALAAGAVGLYFALLAALHLPGNAYQTHPGAFAVTIGENLRAYASARGLLLNVWPIATLTLLAAFGLRSGGAGRGLFRGADMAVIPALAGVALVFTHLFQAGRIVLHAAPLFVLPAVAALRTLPGQVSLDRSRA